MIRYITQGWLVLTLGLVFGAGLAGMQVAVAERIAQNKLDETLSQVPELVPGAVQGRERIVGDQKVYEALDDAGQRVGWVVPTSGQGFVDRIELLIGVNASAERVTGLYVLDQKETPGLGNKIIEPEYRDQYVDCDLARRINVVKREVEEGANEIRSLTGATITCVAVSDTINETLDEELRRELAASGPASGE